MADAGVEERMGDVVDEGSGGLPDGGDAPPLPRSSEPSVADALRGDAEDGDEGASAGEDEHAGDAVQGPHAAEGVDSDSATHDLVRHPRAGDADDASPGDAESGKESPSDGFSNVTGVDEQLSLRVPPSDPTSEDIATLKASVGGQARDNRDAASGRTASVVRREVRRILGLDGKPDFEAESVQHVMGLTRDGEPVNLELEQELMAELAAVGIDLAAVKLRYETLLEEDRRQLTTFAVQRAFVSALDRVEEVASKVSERLGLRIQMFEAQGKDQLKLVSALRELVEAEKEKVEEMVAGVRGRLEAEKADLKRLVERVGGEREQLRELLEENPENVAGAARKKLNAQVEALGKAFDDVGGHLKSCENRATGITERLGSAGAAATAVEQEAARVMSELQRVASAGFAVRRLALLGGAVGSAVGGFFAFVVLLLLWAVTSG